MLRLLIRLAVIFASKKPFLSQLTPIHAFCIIIKNRAKPNIQIPRGEDTEIPEEAVVVVDQAMEPRRYNWLPHNLMDHPVVDLQGDTLAKNYINCEKSILRNHSNSNSDFETAFPIFHLSYLQSTF